MRVSNWCSNSTRHIVGTFHSSQLNVATFDTRTAFGRQLVPVRANNQDFLVLTINANGIVTSHRYLTHSK
jgi:hypothetical protein